jgi:hypothetical protein
MAVVAERLEQVGLWVFEEARTRYNYSVPILGGEARRVPGGGLGTRMSARLRRFA